jgi:hypothetical protein
MFQQQHCNYIRLYTSCGSPSTCFGLFRPSSERYSTKKSTVTKNNSKAGPSGRAVKGVGLRPLGCRDHGFESHRWHGCLVCCECCVLSGRGLCDGLITRPEESYQLWRVFVFDQEISKTRRLRPATLLWKIQPQWVLTPRKQTNN